MKNDIENLRNDLFQAVANSPEDFNLQEVKRLIVKAIDLVEDVEKKRSIREDNHQKRKVNAEIKKYNASAIGLIDQELQNEKAKFEQIKKEALTHRTKRIGQVTEQRERAVAKKKQDRAMALESGAPKRQTAKAIRVKSNVSNRFTPAPNGTPKA